MNRGTVYQQLGGTENLQRAIGSFNNALMVRTRERSLYDWAITQMNLGSSLLSLSYGDRARLPETITALRNAVSGLGNDPNYGAIALYNLSLPLKLAGTAENLEEATKLLEAASAICRQQENVAFLGQVNDMLAEILFKRLEAEKAPKRKFAVVQIAFEFLSQESESNAVAELFFQIGRDLAGELIAGTVNEQVQLAEKALKHALLIWRRPADADNRAAALATLGSIYQHPFFSDRSNGRSASETCLNQGLRILDSLERTPDRLILMNSIYSFLEMKKVNGRR